MWFITSAITAFVVITNHVMNLQWGMVGLKALLTRYHQLDMSQERYSTPNSIHSHLLRQSKRFWFVGWGWFCEGEEGMLREQTNLFRAVVPNVTDAAPCSKWCRRNWTSLRTTCIFSLSWTTPRYIIVKHLVVTLSILAIPYVLIVVISTIKIRINHVLFTMLVSFSVTCLPV